MFIRIFWFFTGGSVERPVFTAFQLPHLLVTDIVHIRIIGLETVQVNGHIIVAFRFGIVIAGILITRISVIVERYRVEWNKCAWGETAEEVLGHRDKVYGEIIITTIKVIFVGELPGSVKLVVYFLNGKRVWRPDRSRVGGVFVGFWG